MKMLFGISLFFLLSMENKLDSLPTPISSSFPFPDEILSILLLDHTTNKNILWATDDYEGIKPESQILITQITGNNSDRIKPRTQKVKTDQSKRTRGKAEVFTPSWICNEQNNLIDEQWFNRTDVFNITTLQKWDTTEEKVHFSTDIQSGRTWQDYIKLNRLEITCGEAPYLVSRYDAVSGKRIKITDRIGILDRKLRVVCENACNEADYMLWTIIAFQSCYGFELQGDSLFLARVNLLNTFTDYTKHFLKRNPTTEEQKSIAQIISWNLWQMDGLTFCTPFSASDDNGQDFLFSEMNTLQSFPCTIKDWKQNKVLKYKSLVKGR